MRDLRDFFEDRGYEVLSVSKNRKGEWVVRTTRGEFIDTYPVEFSSEDVQKVKGFTAS